MKIANSCKGCYFSVGEDLQEGCKLGVLENFEKESTVFELKDGYYQFDRVCLHKTSKQSSVEDALSKNIPITAILKDKDYSATIDNIEKVSFAKRIIIISEDNFGRFVQYINDTGRNDIYVISIMDSPDFKHLLQKSLNGYSVILDNVPDMLYEKIKYFINFKMKRVGLIDGEVQIVNNSLFKYLGNASFLDTIKKSNMYHTWEEVDEAFSNKTNR